jgi:hypothetical protein
MSENIVQKIILALLPLALAAMGYLFTSMVEVRDETRTLTQKMSILIDMDNRIIPSPDNAIARLALREEMLAIKSELEQRIGIIEYRIDHDGRNQTNP